MKRFILITIFVLALVMPVLACSESGQPTNDADLVCVLSDVRSSAENMDDKATEVYDDLMEASDAPVFATFAEFEDNVLVPALTAVPEADLSAFYGASYRAVSDADGAFNVTRANAARVWEENLNIFPNNQTAKDCLNKYQAVTCIGIGFGVSK
jgi:hypothetical protein